MLVKENVRLQRVINGTWKSALGILLVCLLTAAFTEYFLAKHFELPGIFPSLLGTTLAFFIGFNNNQAYARWWEGRIIIGGVSGLSRLLARQCVSHIGQREQVVKMVYRQIAFVYALKEYLRNTNERAYEQYFEGVIPDIVLKAENKYNAILLLQQQHLEQLYLKGWIDGFKFTEFNQTLTALSGEMGKAERIKNTVFPTTYSFYTKLFVWIFIVSVTITFHASIGWVSVVLGAVIGYIYYISYSVGRTLLNPFEPTPVGIPLEHITRATERDLKEVLGETDLPEPVPVIRDEYIL